MKLRSQLIISMIVFGVIVIFVSASIALTNQQIEQINKDAQITGKIQNGASNLAYLSNDYFQNGKSPQVMTWQNQVSNLTKNLSELVAINPELTILINNIKDDLLRLEAIFNNSVAYIQSLPSNESGIVHPLLKTYSTGVTVQNQALSYDTSILSTTLNSQVNQLRQTNDDLIISLLGIFGAYFVTGYFIAFRHILNSITRLKQGTKIIGSGNLDYTIDSKSNDEIGELSSAFNQMAANLKIVTASKDDLETEVAERKKAEAALKEAREQTEFDRKRLETILETSPSAVVIIDALTGKFSYVNKRAMQLYGFDTLGLSLDENVAKVKARRANGTDYPIEEMPVSRSFKHGEEVHNEEMLIERPDGSVLPIIASTAPLRDMKGNVTAAIVVFEDITERKKAEEELKKTRDRFYDSLSRMYGAILLVSAQDKIEFANQAFVEIFNLRETASQLQGLSAGETIEKIKDGYVFPGREIARIKEIVAVGKPVIGEEVEMTGGRIYLRDFIPLNREGKTVSRLWHHIDITKQKMAEKALRERTEQLEETREKLENNACMLEEYSSQMEELANSRLEQLKSAERLAAIGATAGMVGHDIRNPLQAITGDIYLAKTDLASTAESEEKKNIQESLDEIEKNVSYINKIVADLQDYARPLSPKLEEINLEKTVHTVLANINIPGNVTVKHSIRKDFPKLKLDQSYIQRILTNLSNNAIQAMPKGGKLTINAITKNAKVIISVEDTGEGIPDSFRNKLFMPLVTTKSKGQGFGLSVVKRFTEGMGGTVTFESEVGKGTKFIIELPL
jgi:PAS domain S-box-containing protein